MLKKIILMKEHASPNIINIIRTRAPSNLIRIPLINIATISPSYDASTSFTGTLKIGLNKLLKKRPTEKRLRKNLTNSRISRKILRSAYE